MPVNASIPLALDNAYHPRLPDPLTQQARVIALRDLMRRERMGQAQLEELERKRSDAMALRDVFSRHLTPEGTVNRTGVLADLYRINPELAFTVQKNWLAHDKSIAEAHEAKRKADAARSARLGSLAGSVTDQASYRRAIDRALAEGLLTKEEADALPSVYDDNTRAMIEQFRQQALTADQQLQHARAQAEHAARLPGLEAESISKQFRLFGQLAPGAAATTTQWSTLRNVLPERYRNLAPAVPYRGAVEEAEELSMTPEERRSLAERQASLREQERHNREMEQIRREREQSLQAERRQAAAEKEADEITERLRALRSEERRLENEQSPLDEKRRSIGRILETGLHVRKRGGRESREVEITPEEREQYQAEFDSITERWQNILNRKKEIADERQRLQAKRRAGEDQPGSEIAATPIGRPRQVDAATGRTLNRPVYTVEEFIRRARARGVTDIDRALAEARRQGLVQ